MSQNTPGGACIVFRLRGWADSDATPEGAPRREAWETDLLRDVVAALAALS